MRDLFELPIIQAPMAGGPDSPALAAAVSAAGGLGSLGCAYVAPAEIEVLAAAVRARTARPFALNLFIRSDAPEEDAPEDNAGAGAEARVAAVLGPMRAELGLGEAIALGPGLPRWEDQLEAVLGIAPPVLSFTFGVPSRAQVAALRARGIFVVGTATTVDEAGVLDELGVDAICAQGAEAGGHRGTFLGRFEDALVGTLALVPQIVARTRRPVIAAGGIMDGRGIRAALALGATAVQLGTAFLACPEAGTSAPHRAALRDARATVITRAFSGRPARGIRNRMTDAFEAVAPAPFPQQQRMTHELRRAATAQAQPDLMQLWAGQGAPLVRAMPAAELVATLAIEAGLRDP